MEIVKVLHGSRLYGTSHEESDYDWRSVHLPEPSDILLQKAKDLNKQTINEEQDVRSYSLDKYVSDLLKQETHAMEMLFAVPTNSHPIWDELVANKDWFLTNRMSSFWGYLNHQERIFLNPDVFTKGSKTNRKALSHAIRICRELIQLYDHGAIEFPFEPRLADVLCRVKYDRINWDEALEYFHFSMDLAKAKRELNKFPQEPNREAAENFVKKIYTLHINGESNTYAN